MWSVQKGLITEFYSLYFTLTRYGVNSILELELMGNSNFGIRIAYFKKMEFELINLEFKLKFATKKLNSQINLPFHFNSEFFFFHDNPTWNINNSKYVFQVGTRSRYSEYKWTHTITLWTSCMFVWNWIGIALFGIDKFDVELTKWNGVELTK